jgi:quercetin dioxygenase-like cupin family protein
MKIIKSLFAGEPSEKKTEHFTGPAWNNVVLPYTDGLTVNSIFFTPGSRTDWHSHEGGQLLHAMSGQGVVCSDGEEPVIMAVGDVVWTSPGERHWHGGGEHTGLQQLAVSIGPTTWLGPVLDHHDNPDLPEDKPA